MAISLVHKFVAFTFPVWLAFTMPALAFTCLQIPSHGNADTDGTITWAPILLSPSDPRPDPHFLDMNLGNSTLLDVAQVDVEDGVPYLVGRLYFRSELIVDRDITSPEKDWACDYGIYESDGGRVPDRVRDDIALTVKEILIDPYSIRSVRIGTVMRSVQSPHAASATCVWLNAKNAMGGYVGISSIAVFFDTDEDFAWIPASLSDDICMASKSVEAFPELGPEE